MNLTYDLTKRAGSRAARGAKTNAAMYMSNEYRYLKYILFNYYAGHGTGVLSVGVCGSRYGQ